MQMLSVREAMEKRHSVRSYLSTPIPQDILLTMKQAVKEYASAAKMRIQLVTEEPDAFKGFLDHYGHFVGVRNYIAFVGQKDDTLDERTGYYGELEVAATFHKSIYALLEPKEIKKFLDGENFGYKS